MILSFLFYCIHWSTSLNVRSHVTLALADLLADVLYRFNINANFHAQAEENNYKKKHLGVNIHWLVLANESRFHNFS